MAAIFSSRLTTTAAAREVRNAIDLLRPRSVRLPASYLLSETEVNHEQR